MTSRSFQHINIRLIHSADLSSLLLLCISVHPLFYLILKMVLGEGGCCYAHFAEEDTEAQKVAQVVDPAGGRASV